MFFYSGIWPFTIFSIGITALFFVFEGKLSKNWMRWAWWIISIAILVAVGSQVSENYIWADFNKGYYHGGRKIINDQSLLYGQKSCEGYVNFPLFAYLFAPLGALPKEEAGKAFFVLGLIGTMALAYWLVKFANLNGWKRWFILLLLALSGPLDYSLDLGNTTHFIALFMLIALWWFKNEQKQWLTGILLAINGLIKIPLIIPSGYYFLRRQWKVVAGGIIIAFGTIALSIWLIPEKLNLEWLDKCILTFSRNPIAAHNNQSFNGFLARALMPDSNLKYWHPIQPSPLFSTLSPIVTYAIYLSLVPIIIFYWKT